MADTIPDRPSEVTTAVYLLWIDLGLAIITGILEYSVPGGKTSEGLGILAISPFVALLYYMISRGKNWARLVLLILWFLGAALTVNEFFNRPPISGWLDIIRIALETTESIVVLIALTLMFQRISSAWFRATSGPLTNPFKSIPNALRNTDRPIFGYVWRAWLIAQIPVILLLPIVIGVITASGFQPPSPDSSDLLHMSWHAILVAPWLETLLMWPILWILKWIIHRTILVAVASAVIFGILHALSNPVQGITSIWPFFVFSICFLEWEKKSKGKAIATTALVHLCNNLVGVLPFFLERLF